MPIARYGFPKPPAQEAVPEDTHPVLGSYEDYEAVKQEHPDEMVLYQAVGVFELYGEDAEAAAELWEQGQVPS